MKIGQPVLILREGDPRFTTKGEVIATRNGHHIKVRFCSLYGYDMIEMWCRKVPAVRYFRLQLKKSYMNLPYVTHGKSKTFFKGICPGEQFYPIYTVQRLK